ncbi:MAG TPA: nucleotidyltransferase family protein [Pyrinomonadaceae bacterium]|jgi:molybdenum cofactor cytidylyltransferase
MPQPHKPKISLIVLAAGASSRMNDARKQLLVYKGKTLLRQAAETAIESEFENVIVVLSAAAENFIREIEDLPVQTVINENAKIGISSSIKTGLSALAVENYDAVIIMLCDQPLISTKTLRKLGDVFILTGKPIVACEYENTFGVPVLFARPFFSELMNLSEDEGAKKIIKKYRERTEFIRCPEAATDIDTVEDYQKLLQNLL